MKHIIDDADKNKYEAFTKQEVLNAIQEAISSGELPEEINGLVITLKNPIDNHGYKIAFCTQAKYNELQSGGHLEGNCYYFITDDTTADDLDEHISQVANSLNTTNNNVANIQIKISKDSVSPSNITQTGLYAISASYTDGHEDFSISDLIYITHLGDYQILSKYCKYTRANGIQLLPDYSSYMIQSCDLIYKI